MVYLIYDQAVFHFSAIKNLANYILIQNNIILYRYTKHQKLQIQIAIKDFVKNIKMYLI